VLRLSSHLLAIVLSSGVYTAAICGLAWFLAPRGLTGVAAAWPIGALLAALVSTTVAAVSRSVPARHRRTGQPRTDGHRADRQHRADEHRADEHRADEHRADRQHQYPPGLRTEIREQHGQS
jgi:hypothetical protein